MPQGAPGLCASNWSLFTIYLSLSSHISTFDKNNRCLEELMKITYDPL